MTRVKLCGLSRPCDITWANALQPDYIGFVFAPKSRRYVSPVAAASLRQTLQPGIRAVGVFVKEDPAVIAALLTEGVIDIAQLHGGEDDAYIAGLRTLTQKPLIQAFHIASPEDAEKADRSPADWILLDSADAGSGKSFDWNLLQQIRRPYFLAGGLTPENVSEAVTLLHPWAVDVSSGIETDGRKDGAKMAAFTVAVRKEEIL